MSTHVHDLRSSASIAAGVSPTTITATTSGPAVFLAGGDGPCFAIQQVGGAPGDGTLAGKIEQSADGTTWSAIAGATFLPVGGPNDTQIVRFSRSAKYVRWVGTLAGDSPAFTVAVLFGEQSKTF